MKNLNLNPMAHRLIDRIPEHLYHNREKLVLDQLHFKVIYSSFVSQLLDIMLQIPCLANDYSLLLALLADRLRGI
jgi:hypothetical protein